MTTENDAPAEAGVTEEMRREVQSLVWGDAAPKSELSSDEPADPADSDAETTTAADAGAAPEAALDTAPAATDDIWANAPETYRTAYDALKHKHDSERNRAAALNRKVTTLNREIGALKATPAQEPAAPKVVDRGKIKELREEYSDLGPVFDALEAQDDRLTAREAAEQAAASDAFVAEEAALDGMHPGWGEYLQTHSEQFNAFVNNPDLPMRHYRAWEENKDAIVDSTATGALLTAFKASLAPRPPTPPDTTRTSDRRARQLSGSSTPPPRSAGGALSDTPGEDADPATLRRWAQAEVWKS